MNPLSIGQKEQNDRIRVAMTWARLFVREAQRDLEGLPSLIVKASAQTVAAIESIYDLNASDFEITENDHERNSNG